MTTKNIINAMVADQEAAYLIAKEAYRLQEEKMAEKEGGRK
jgi:hypothetical protein